MILNFLIHQWLSERGLVEFVVSVPPIPDNVYNYIFAEFLPIFQAHEYYFIDHFRIVRIDMENGSHDRLCQFSAIESGTRVPLHSGKPNLVICYYVNDPSRLVLFQILKLICLIHHSKITQPTLIRRELHHHVAPPRYSFCGRYQSRNPNGLSLSRKPPDPLFPNDWGSAVLSFSNCVRFQKSNHGLYPDDTLLK